jgi:hypothetical protein
MGTCLDQYKADKAGDVNGGLKWTQKVAATTASATASSRGLIVA